MLFNSYPFLFLYLPLTLLAFLVLRRGHRSLAIGGLFLASLIFYGVWNPRDVLLLLGSILFNFWIGQKLQKPAPASARSRRLWLQLGIAIDLGLLGYYKYAGFTAENLGTLLGIHFDLPPILLPLGISFFTFTQIAFLVDCYRGEVREGRFLDYGLFVTYFPHLIAGPVLHHKEMMPQFRSAALSHFRWEDFSIGATLFTMGLFKKVVFADGIAPFARAVFDGPAGTPDFFEA
ncbi:MAG TPA: membrane-bound O-acyltransferase family protein, partial [Methylococcaceae bacterium]|nr:membrane-bound O-acyltransferase family protein [Methylococcaceae bacterium]